MSWLEMLDLASSIARLSFVIAAPVAAACASYKWHKGKNQEAVYLLGWAIFIKLLSGN